MTNQEQYDDIWKSANKVPLLEAEIKSLVDALDRTTKQRNALIIALNYVNNTINTMDECQRYNPKYTKRFYRKSIRMMKEVMKNGLLMAVDNSKDTIKLEVKEDDI